MIDSNWLWKFVLSLLRILELVIIQLGFSSSDRVNFFTLFVGNDLLRVVINTYILLFLNLEIELFINLAVKNAK